MARTQSIKSSRNKRMLALLLVCCVSSVVTMFFAKPDVIQQPALRNIATKPSNTIQKHAVRRVRRSQKTQQQLDAVQHELNSKSQKTQQELDAVQQLNSKSQKSQNEMKQRRAFQSEAQKDLKSMDRNSDSVVNRQEFLASGGIYKDFRKYDLNADRALDVDELERRVAFLKAAAQESLAADDEGPHPHSSPHLAPSNHTTASTCFSGPDPVPTHSNGQCSGPSHPLGLFIQDAFVADKNFNKAYIIAQDMRMCNSSAYWQPQKELYDISYTCHFRVWTEGKWGNVETVNSIVMFREPATLKSQIIIQCPVPSTMQQYGDNAGSAAQARLSVVVTPVPKVSAVHELVSQHGPVPSTNQLGLCAYPVDPTDQTVLVASPKRHKLAVCMWVADTYNDRYNIPFSSTAPQMPEWLEHHLHVGVEHFYVYDNSEHDRGPLWKLLQPYVKEGLATYIRWPHKVCVPRRIGGGLFGKGAHAHRSSQYAASNSCLRRYAQYNDWIAMFDIDEYLIPAGYGRAPPGIPATPRLPATLTEVLEPYTNDSAHVDVVSFMHVFHQPCGDYLNDNTTHKDPMLQIGTTHRHFEMRTAADVGKHRRPGAQGDNAALFMEGYMCSRVGGPSPKESPQVKSVIKPYKVLYQFVHYSVVSYGGTRHKDKYKKLLDMHTQGRMLHFRAQQQHVWGTVPDLNLTESWLPELRRALKRPQVVRRLRAVQDYLSSKPLDVVSVVPLDSSTA